MEASVHYIMTVKKRMRDKLTLLAHILKRLLPSAISGFTKVPPFRINVSAAGSYIGFSD